MKFGINFQLQTPRPLDADQWHEHDELHIAPYGRTLQPQPRYQGPDRGALEAYVPRLITSTSS